MEDVYKKFTEIDNLYIFNEVYSDTLYALFISKVFSFAYMYILKDIN